MYNECRIPALMDSWEKLKSNHLKKKKKKPLKISRKSNDRKTLNGKKRTSTEGQRADQDTRHYESNDATMKWSWAGHTTRITGGAEGWLNGDQWVVNTVGKKKRHEICERGLMVRHGGKYHRRSHCGKAVCQAVNSIAYVI